MLKQLRQAITAAAPAAEERISYGRPFYNFHGRLIYFAEHKKHVGVYPVGRAKTVYAKELAPYLAAKDTLRFPIGDPLPIGLIKKVVRERTKETAPKAGRSDRDP